MTLIKTNTLITLALPIALSTLYSCGPEQINSRDLNIPYNTDSAIEESLDKDESQELNTLLGSPQRTPEQEILGLFNAIQTLGSQHSQVLNAVEIFSQDTDLSALELLIKLEGGDPSDFIAWVEKLVSSPINTDENLNQTLWAKLLFVAYEDQLRFFPGAQSTLKELNKKLLTEYTLLKPDFLAGTSSTLIYTEGFAFRPGPGDTPRCHNDCSARDKCEREKNAQRNNSNYVIKHINSAQVSLKNKRGEIIRTIEAQNQRTQDLSQRLQQNKEANAQLTNKINTIQTQTNNHTHRVDFFDRTALLSNSQQSLELLSTQLSTIQNIQKQAHIQALLLSYGFDGLWRKTTLTQTLLNYLHPKNVTALNQLSALSGISNDFSNFETLHKNNRKELSNSIQNLDSSRSEFKTFEGQIRALEQQLAEENPITERAHQELSALDQAIQKYREAKKNFKRFISEANARKCPDCKTYCE